MSTNTREKWLAFPKRFCETTGIPRYFVRQVMFELRMLLLRIHTHTPGVGFQIRKLQQKPDLKLMFGCGEIRRHGWVGIDCFSGPVVDLQLDLRRPIPFQDKSVEHCYSEHFLEHLYPEEALLHLRDVCRILRPGGVYRIVVPASMRFAEKYLVGETAFFALAHPWESRPIDAVYKMFNWQGQHRSIYDVCQFSYLANQAGFADVRESAVNESEIPALRIDRSEPQRVAESLYVELVKG